MLNDPFSAGEFPVRTAHEASDCSALRFVVEGTGTFAGVLAGVFGIG